jgi:hypothetical protein
MPSRLTLQRKDHVMSEILPSSRLRGVDRYPHEDASVPIARRLRLWIAFFRRKPTRSATQGVSSLPTVACRCDNDDEVNSCRTLATRVNLPYRIVSAPADISDAMTDVAIVPLRHLEAELEFAGRLIVIRNTGDRS